MTIARGLASAALAVSLLAGCSSGTNSGAGSSSRAPVSRPAAVLDGTYNVNYDYGAKTVNGKPTPTQAQQQDPWGVRSACTDKGCVASRGVIKNGKPEAPMTLDYIDGKWVGMYRSPDHKCANGGTAPYYRWVSLEPKPDGTLAGEAFWMYFGTSCPQVTWLPFTLRKSGRCAAGVERPIRDPAANDLGSAGFSRPVQLQD